MMELLVEAKSRCQAGKNPFGDDFLAMRNVTAEERAQLGKDITLCIEGVMSLAKKRNSMSSDLH